MIHWIPTPHSHRCPCSKIEPMHSISTVHMSVDGGLRTCYFRKGSRVLYLVCIAGTERDTRRTLNQLIPFSNSDPKGSEYEKRVNLSPLMGPPLSLRPRGKRMNNGCKARGLNRIQGDDSLPDARGFASYHGRSRASLIFFLANPPACDTRIQLLRLAVQPAVNHQRVFR